MQLTVLQNGSCETFKAGVHATAFGLSAVMGLYNAAAWLSRREQHLAVNALLYAALTVWEQQHVAHHIDTLRRLREPAEAPAEAPAAAVAAVALGDLAA